MHANPTKGIAGNMPPPAPGGAPPMGAMGGGPPMGAPAPPGAGAGIANPDQVRQRIIQVLKRIKPLAAQVGIESLDAAAASGGAGPSAAPAPPGAGGAPPMGGGMPPPPPAM